MKALTKIYRSGLIGLFIGINLLVSSCEKKGTEGEGGNVVSENSDNENWKTSEEENTKVPLNVQIDQLLSNIDTLQKQAFASEQTKVKSGLMLIDEIKLSLKKYDNSKLTELQTLCKEMETALYNEQTMGNESAMVAYDAATEKFIKALNSFVETTPELSQHARARVLLNEIIQADGSDFMLRKNYNSAVEEYNKLINRKKDDLNGLGEKYKNLSLKKLFYGEPAS
jgi:hypothetical protein